MASREELPSCSRTTESVYADEAKMQEIIINKFPVVMLPKLDLDMLSVKINAEDMEVLEKQIYDMDGSSRKAMYRAQVKASSWIEDAGVTESFSDGEVETESSGKEMRGTATVKGSVKRDIGLALKKENVQVKNKDTINKVSLESQKGGKREISSEKRDPVKKPSAEDIAEMIAPFQDLLMKNKDKVMFNSNGRYKLVLDSVHKTALGSESFRKLINLAADCAISFKKKEKPVDPFDGNIELYFGDVVTLQLAMQRLGQLVLPTCKPWMKAAIKCYELKPSDGREKTDKWKVNVSAKLYFQFSPLRGKTLQQLISSKSRKKEDANRKSVQIYRIPSSLNEEMLSLLFPFSVGVKISGPENTDKHTKGPVDIEFESQEWMEAVMMCFRDFGVSLMGDMDNFFKFIFKNFTPPMELPNEHAQSEVTTYKSGSYQKPRIGLNQNKNLPKTRSLEHVPEKNSGRSNQGSADKEQNSTDQRKRTYPGQRIVRDQAPKRGRFDITAQVRTPRMDITRSEAHPQHVAPLDANKEGLRQMALARGLNPNNPDVLKILEMTSQIETMQKLQEERETRRFQTARQAQIEQSRGRLAVDEAGNLMSQTDSLRQNMEKARRMQQAEFQISEVQKLKGSIASKQKLLKEIDLKLRSQAMHRQREGHRGADVDLNHGHNFPTASAASEILPFGNAPPTSGLLGPAPAGEMDQSAVDPDRNDRPLDFNRPPPKLTTEQAFNQDIERTRAILATGGRPFPHRREEPQLVQEDTRDRHCLPVQFGKNAVKKIPKDIIEKERRALEVNRYRDRMNAAVLEGNPRAPHKNIPPGVGPQVTTFLRKNEEEMLRRNLAMQGPRRGVAGVEVPNDGLLGPVPTDAVIPTDLQAGMRGGQNPRPFNRGPAGVSQVGMHGDPGAAIDAQWRRNNQEKLRGQGLREPPMYEAWNDLEETQDQLYQESEPDYGMGEWIDPARLQGPRVARGRNEQPSQIYAGEQYESYPKRKFEENYPNERMLLLQQKEGLHQMQRKRQLPAEEYPDSYAAELRARPAAVRLPPHAREANIGPRVGMGAEVLAGRAGLAPQGQLLPGYGDLSRAGLVSKRGRGDSRGPAANNGRGLLPLPEDFGQRDPFYEGEDDERHEDAVQEQSYMQPLNQPRMEPRGMGVVMYPHLAPTFLGNRSGQGVNFI